MLVAGGESTSVDAEPVAILRQSVNKSSGNPAEHYKRPRRRPAAIVAAAVVVSFGALVPTLLTPAVTTGSIDRDQFAVFARAVDAVQRARGGGQR